MDHLWSPWRYRFIANGPPKDGCVLCKLFADREHDEQNLVVFRGERCFVVLNLYPYTSGHIMIVPNKHVSSLEAAGEETMAELMRFAGWAERALHAAYQPDGINLGMNLGSAAGAGIAEHIHMHVLPRWAGDANFMSTIGETRVLPEELPVTWRKLRDEFALLSR